MAAPLLTRRRIMVFGAESTPGTAVSVGTTAIHAQDVVFTPGTPVDEFPGTLRGGVRGGMGGARQGTVTFTVKCTTKGSSTAPDWFGLMQGVALLPTAGVYMPTSNPPGSAETPAQKTLTIGWNADGRYQQLTGAVGNVVFNGVAGSTLEAQFTFTGKHTKQSAVALPTPTYPSAETPLRVASGGLTIGGTAQVLAEFSLDLGNVLTLIGSAADETGFLHGVVPDRRPNGTLQVEAAAIDSNYAPQTWLEVGTTKAVVLTIGTGAGRLIIGMDRWLVNAPPTESDREGVTFDSLPFTACRSDAGDDELELSWGS